MTRKFEKRDDCIISSSEESVRSINYDPDDLNEGLRLIEEISRKHKLDIKRVIELVTNGDKYASLPLGIFRSDLGPLEAVVRYMKDVLDYSFAKTAKLLRRDETTIWTTYRNSVKKGNLIVDFEFSDIDFRRIGIKKEDTLIPVSIFSNRKVSVLESLGLYLKDNLGLSYHAIALLLNRDDRTIWTVVNRAKNKLKDG